MLLSCDCAVSSSYGFWFGSSCSSTCSSYNCTCSSYFLVLNLILSGLKLESARADLHTCTHAPAEANLNVFWALGSYMRACMQLPLVYSTRSLFLSVSVSPSSTHCLVPSFYRSRFLVFSLFLVLSSFNPSLISFLFYLFIVV